MPSQFLSLANAVTAALQASPAVAGGNVLQGRALPVEIAHAAEVHVAVARSQAELGVHDAVLEKCRITAPFAGRVAEQKVREQQVVQPGQALLDILDDSSLELEFLVPSAWLRWLKVGLPLRVAIDETRKTYPARFTRIGARVDAVSQSVKVAAVIEGSPQELVAGMSGRVMATPP